MLLHHRSLKTGQMGPVIDIHSHKKILGYIEQSEKEGAQIILDGRSWISKMKDHEEMGGGCWIGPTVIIHNNKTDKAMNEEVFGPVLSVYNVSTWHEAIAIENSNPFGNAAAIYTSNGGHAEWFLKRVRASVSILPNGNRLCPLLSNFILADDFQSKHPHWLLRACIGLSRSCQ